MKVSEPTDGDAVVPLNIFEGHAGPCVIELRIGGATSDVANSEEALVA